MAFPGKQRGHVQVVDLLDIEHKKQQSTIISAHNHSISAIALNRQATLLATASGKGTLIRLYNIDSAQMIQELRRGADQAEIYDVTFSEDSTRIAVASDKGTIHIFALSCEDPLQNRESSLKIIKDILPKYFSSQWSPAHARISDTRSIVTFCLPKPDTNPNALIVLSWDGTLYKFVFDPQRGGACMTDIVTRFLNLTPFNAQLKLE